MRYDRRQLDRARPFYTALQWFGTCCDTRIPGRACTRCGAGPDDQTISQNRALASNA